MDDQEARIIELETALEEIMLACDDPVRVCAIAAAALSWSTRDDAEIAR